MLNDARAPLLDVFVPGKPIARPSARMWKRRKDLFEWSRTVAWTVRACMVGRPLVDEPVELRLLIRTDGAGDASNFAKLIEDSLTKVFYTDDKLVRELRVRIEGANGTEGVRIEAYRFRRD
jgi:Holliday junction resolvase RusA-like endonuclease